MKKKLYKGRESRFQNKLRFSKNAIPENLDVNSLHESDE
mgnify:CR=1 FL=1